MTSKGELLRQRIVSAADQLFYQQGFENTSFSDIAGAVDISRGNFYYHFKSKDEILDAVIEKRCIDIKKMLSSWEQPDNKPEQNISLYIDMLVRNQDNIKNHGCPVGSMCTELNKINHFMHNDAIKMHTLFRDWLTKQFEQLGHEKDAQQLAMHLLARGQGIATITSSFEDEAFLLKEVEMLREWVGEVVSRKS